MNRNVQLGLGPTTLFIHRNHSRRRRVRVLPQNAPYKTVHAITTQNQVTSLDLAVGQDHLDAVFILLDVQHSAGRLDGGLIR